MLCRPTAKSSHSTKIHLQGNFFSSSQLNPKQRHFGFCEDFRKRCVSHLHLKDSFITSNRGKEVRKWNLAELHVHQWDKKPRDPGVLSTDTQVSYVPSATHSLTRVLIWISTPQHPPCLLLHLSNSTKISQSYQGSP